MISVIVPAYRGVLSKPAVLATGVGLVALAVYLATMAPGLTWAHDSADGGELAAAARTLGVAHPPGYPTYLLLAHPFTLLPLGEVATRTQLLSAVCAAGTAAALTWALARGAGCRAAAAVGAGLALALSPLLWSQATVTEVYALNTLFTALLLTQASPRPPITASPCPRVSVSLLAGAIWGLSLGNHPTALFCAPLLIVALARLRRQEPAPSLSRGWWGIAGVALGLAVYLYLPLRAAAAPPVNWGDPRTLARFWWVVSGALYRPFAFALPWAYLPARLSAWAGLLAGQFSVVGLPLALLGAAVSWPARRSLVAATGLVVALNSAFALGYNTTDSYLYLLPALPCLAFWLGLGADWGLRALARRAVRAGRAAAALVILLPALAGAFRFRAMDLSGDRAASDFRAVLDAAPPDAVVVSQEDAHTFALWYFQYAQGVRADVVVVDPGLVGYDWYVADLSRRLGAPWPAGLSWDELAGRLGRPVCQIEEGGRLSCEARNAGFQPALYAAGHGGGGLEARVPSHVSDREVCGLEARVPHPRPSTTASPFPLPMRSISGNGSASAQGACSCSGRLFAYSLIRPFAHSLIRRS